MIYDGKDNDIISQYVAFTKVYDEQVKLYGRTREAVTNTIHICKDRDVLKEYLSSREKEVVDMMMTLFDEEQVMRAYVESERKEAAKKAAVISAIEIYQEMGLPVSETIKRWQENISLKKTMQKHGFRDIRKEMGKTNSFYSRYRKVTWRHLLAYKHLIAPYPK